MPHLYLVDEGWGGKLIDIDIDADQLTWSINVYIKATAELSKEYFGENLANLIYEFVSQYNLLKENSEEEMLTKWFKPDETAYMRIGDMVQAKLMENDFSIRLVFEHEVPLFDDEQLQQFFDTIKSNVKDQASLYSFLDKTFEQWKEYHKNRMS
tara:strand:- start:4921 stop:5382 length:462 start_codon:yes stop_codon:yes gene_type:complete